MPAVLFTQSRHTGIVAMIRRIALSIAVVALGLSVVRLQAAEKEKAPPKFFDSNGVKIHYEVTGAGEPVVLIHGFSANIQAQWGLPGILNKLAKQYQVVAMDNRGHGKSDKPHDPKQYGPEMIADVLRLMDHLNLPKAHVVGYSMGGFMTGYLVTHYPDRVITATLGGAGWRKPDDARLAVMDQLADSLDEGKGIGPLIVLLTPANRPKPTDEQIEAINSMLMLTNDAKALAACVRGMAGMSVTEAQWRANKVPTLALIGSDDPLKVGVDELAEVSPTLKVEVLDGADHMTTFQRPQFVEDLQEFIEAHAKVPAAAAAQ
jgi:pimeloyl-ACP methyl ester carboxylesterase